MKKVLVVFGTRPEAIKMSPLIHELKKRKELDVKVCVTGQHRELLDQVLEIYSIIPDHNLKIMKDNQTLFDITSSILEKIKGVLIEEKPDLVLVHGDTSTAFVTSLSSFYLRIPVGHVEAGLRTRNLDSPFPEEFNRQAIGLIAKLHFAPTELAKQNLLSEGKTNNHIFVTGNTAIDALKMNIDDKFEHPLLEWSKNHKLILITAHRRENFGEPLRNMFSAIRQIIIENESIKAIYPIHLNPSIRKIANEFFHDVDRMKIVEPLGVFEFHNILARTYIILTDSGGIQEEAPSLGVPVLVMRDTTERPEGVAAGTLKVVGTSKENIYSAFSQLINDEEQYLKMSLAKNPYGDGNASVYITNIIIEMLTNKS